MELPDARHHPENHQQMENAAFAFEGPIERRPGKEVRVFAFFKKEAVAVPGENQEGRIGSDAVSDFLKQRFDTRVEITPFSPSLFEISNYVVRSTCLLILNLKTQ